jgi:hypothetical protein
LVASTYLGGSSDGFPGANAVALDSSGNDYLAGSTDSTNFRPEPRQCPPPVIQRSFPAEVWVFTICLCVTNSAIST